MQHSPCPGRCNTDQPPELLLPGAPIWCRGCTHRITHALTMMPALCSSLWLEVQHATGRRAERVSGSPPRPLHSRQAYTLLMHEMAEVLTSWEDAVRAERDLAPRPRAVRHGQRITGSCRFLLKHLEWILGGGVDPVAFGEEAMGLAHRARALTHQAERTPQSCKPVPCRRCGRVSLEWEIAAGCSTGWVVCSSCQTLFSEEEYHTLVRETLGQAMAALGAQA